MNPLIENFISRFVHRFVARYYVRITILSAVVTAVAIWVIATQWNINSDFRALLPQDSEAAQAMEEVGERVGSGSALFVVVDSPDMEANKEFAGDFAEQLRQMPSVALAHYHNDKDFFEKRQLLYLRKPGLGEIRERIAEKIEQEKKEANPLFASLESEDEDEDGEFIETGDIRAKYSDRAHRQPEYFVAEDGYSLTMIVRFTESSTDMAATNRLISKVKQTGQDLNPESYNRKMTLEYGGGLINRQDDYGQILGDIKSSALFTLLGLFLVISLYFRRIRATALIMIPLIMGVCWTLAVAFLMFGELTTVSVFIFAILLGLGIDYSIHLLSGYDHARLEGRKPQEALIRTYKGVGGATTIGAMTTFATFVVLSFADFRGLSQFGQVASTGVAFTLTAMIVVLPSLILTFNAVVEHDITHRVNADKSITPFVTTRQIGTFAPWAVGIALVVTGLSVSQYGKLAFEEDFRNLGNIEWPWERAEGNHSPAEMQRDARAQAKRLGKRVWWTAVDRRQVIDPDSYEKVRLHDTTEEKFRSALRNRRSSTPTVLLFDDAREAARVTEYMRRLNREGKLDTINSITSVHAFVPGSQQVQERRREELEKIQKLLNEEDLSFLDDEERDKLEKFRDQLQAPPFDRRDLPTWAKRLFREAGDNAHAPADSENFAYEYVVYVNEGIDQMEGKDARRFLEQIQQVRQETDADFRIGSQSYIYVQMLDEIKHDGVKMISIALVLVLLILGLAFRSPLRGLVAMTPLIVGALWMFGMLTFVGLKLDFFNVIIIPVVIGIGVDAGVHFYRRYLERGRGSVATVTRTVGSAVTMASITSGVGFGGLAVTEHGGLSSIGHLAIVGISTTLVATLLVTPVILWATEYYEIEWLLPRESDLADRD